MGFEELRDRTMVAANQANHELEEASKITEVALGNTYVFRTDLVDHADETIALEWVVVVQHKDDSELWLVVAADQNEWFGSQDIKSSAGSPLILRCGCGFWVHSKDIEAHARCVGVVEEGIVMDARTLLRNIFRTLSQGGLSPDTLSEEQKSTDRAYDYKMYMGEVLMCSVRLEKWIHDNHPEKD